MRTRRVRTRMRMIRRESRGGKYNLIECTEVVEYLVTG